MKYREYAYTGTWADGSLHTDTVYVPIGPFPVPASGIPRNDDRIVYDVQDYPSERLASTMDRKWAAAYLRIRRLAGRPNTARTINPVGDHTYTDRHGRTELRIHEGSLSRRTAEYVPNMPYGEYAEPNTVVLHDTGDGGMSSYGYKSGETAEGTSYTETRLDSGSYDNFHFNCECSEHGDELLCPQCGHGYDTICRPPECDCGEFDFSVVESCAGCGAMYDCLNGQCDCIDRLEQCSICEKDLGDGDAVWLCLDGGEYICPEHVVVDERPDGLFKRVDGVRGALLPAFAFPGGYCIVYYTRDNQQLCAECASRADCSDPAVTADADEEMDCQDCGHAQSEHASEKAHRTDGNSDDVGPCSAEITREDTYGREYMYECSCEGYWPPTCEDCSLPIDPALRGWWASRNKVTA